MTNTLKERSKNLTSISLESFISDITAEGENHNFSELLSHPHVHTIKPQYQHLINLFAFGTYQDYLQKRYDVSQLNEKQTQTLRRLSILSAIKGVEAINVIKLQQILGVSSQEVIDLLLAMNISGQVSTKIDEEKGKVLILAAELRAEKEPLNKGALRSKISQIVQKNQSISEEISSIQKLIG